MTKKVTREITGRKVLFIALGAFGAIITANMTLAVAAIGTFPGLEVKNSYVASQGFDAEREAQMLLGWRALADYEDGALVVKVVDRDGHPAALSDLAVRLGRPTGEARNITADLIYQIGGVATEIDLSPGLWRVDVVATGMSGDRFRQHLTLRAAE